MVIWFDTAFGIGVVFEWFILKDKAIKNNRKKIKIITVKTTLFCHS